jgi:hypothetical protein
MAAGLGFKDFATGEVLTAADVDGYLMQGIWVFASNAARDAAVTAPAEGNFAFTKDTNSLWYYDGAAWVSSGATGDIEGVTAGVGISGGGTSGTVTVTNSMATAIDAKGDLIVGTGADTFSRLAVGGTNGHILQVDSGEATGVKWAAPAAATSGLTLITKSPFTTVSSHSVDNCFTSTYANYKVLIKWSAVSADNVDLTLRLRASGSDTSTNYNCQRLFAFATTVTTDTDPSGNDDWIAGVADKDFAAVPFLEMEIASPQVATTTSMVLRQYGYTTEQFLHFVGGRQNSSTQFDGFKVLANTGTMSGTVWVYGYQEA